MQMNPAAPQFGAPGAGLVLISYWTVATPEDQHRAAAFAMDLWQDSGWPKGLLSHHLFAGDDGRTVMNYSRWTGDAAFAAYLASDQPGRAHKIETGAVAITRDSIGRYRPGRSIPGLFPGARAGSYIAATFEVPDAAARTALVDRLILTGTPATSQGDIATHVHLSDCGTRVVTIAECTEAERRARQSGSNLAAPFACNETATLMRLQSFALLTGKTSPQKHAIITS